MRKNILFLIIISSILFLSSCELFQREIEFNINDWYQDADGTLFVDFTLDNVTSEDYSLVKAGFAGHHSNGYTIAYGRVDDVLSGESYSGTASTTYTQGELISSVNFFVYTTVKSSN